jgi:hypothetical protein
MGEKSGLCKKGS